MLAARERKERKDGTSFLCVPCVLSRQKYAQDNDTFKDSSTKTRRNSTRLHLRVSVPPWCFPFILVSASPRYVFSRLRGPIHEGARGSDLARWLLCAATSEGRAPEFHELALLG